MEQTEFANYKTVLVGGEGRYEEKKSVFLAEVRPVSTEEEAIAFIDERKKKYWDARHNCSAYVLGTRSEHMRASDDGEPQGTAGRPILDVLTGNGITDAAIVVTRYFGGTLLGTGGLVRAYTQASKDALANSRILEKTYGAHLMLDADYGDLGKLQYLLATLGVPTLTSDYTDRVRLEIILPVGERGALERELADATAGRVRIEELGLTYYGKTEDGEILL